MNGKLVCVGEEEKRKICIQPKDTEKFLLFMRLYKLSNMMQKAKIIHSEV